MRFLVNNPFVYLCLSLMAGIFCARFVTFSSLLLAMACAVCFILAVVFRKHKYVFSGVLGACMFLLGAFLCRKAGDDAVGTFTDKSALFQVCLLSEPVEKPKTYACEVSVQYAFPSDTLSSGPVREHGCAIVYLPKDSLSSCLHAGDILLVDAFFPSYKPESNPCMFDYPAYLLRQGIASTAYVPRNKWVSVGHTSSFSLRRWAAVCQRKLLTVYERYGISGQEYAVLSALTLGYKESLDSDTKRIYSASGAMHILAVSGLHVGIVYFVLYYLLFFLGNSFRGRVLRSLLLILFLWVYAFVTGLSPSVMRACLMFSVGQLAVCFDRRGSVFNTLAFSAFLLLVVDPLLLYNVSFQLSYSAVLAIVLLQPRLSALVKVKLHRVLRWFLDLACVSLAAQIGTFVWSLLYFNQFSTYFLLTNFVVIPAATLVIPLALLLFVVSPFPLLAGALGRLLSFLLSCVNAILSHIEALPFSTLQIYIDAFQAFLLFGCVTCVLIIVFRGRKYLFPAVSVAMLCLMVFFSIRFYRLYDTCHTNRLVVYAAGRQPVIQCTAGHDNYVFTADTVQSDRYTSLYSLKHRLSRPQTLLLSHDSFVPFTVGGERCLFLSGNLSQYDGSPYPLFVDNLIVGQISYFHPDKLFFAIRPGRVIMSEAVGWRQRNLLLHYCSDHHIPCVDIRTSGAFILSSKF